VTTVDVTVAALVVTENPFLSPTARCVSDGVAQFTAAHVVPLGVAGPTNVNVTVPPGLLWL
jgi:hypothetical protein